MPSHQIRVQQANCDHAWYLSPDGDPLNFCIHCGIKYVVLYQKLINDKLKSEYKCHNCLGTGNEPEAGFNDSPCQDCNGTGVIKNQNLTDKINVQLKSHFSD